MKDLEKEVLEQSQLKDKDLEQVVGGNDEIDNLRVQSLVILEDSKAIIRGGHPSDMVQSLVILEDSKAVEY